MKILLAILMLGMVSIGMPGCEGKSTDKTQTQTKSTSPGGETKTTTTQTTEQSGKNPPPPANSR